MEDMEKKKWFRSKPAKIALAAIVIFLAGYFFRALSQRPDAGAKQEHLGQQEVVQKWTCSMHPQIITDQPGKCPICGMDLIPLTIDSTAGIGARELVVSKEAAKLMEIETATVRREFVAAEVRMVGKIDYDETQVKNITAWVPGRIDRLYVDFTGTTVNKGDHMVYLYSPELLSAQAELLQAVKSAANIKPSVSKLINRSILATLEAAREKLRLLGLTAEQIAEIEKSGKPVDHLTIYAPIGGIVIHKNATEGIYVKTGTNIYAIADLSHLWVQLDAYESDLPWIRYGQEVEFTTEAYPGEVFKGIISFIDPVLNARTRTVKLRVNVDNPEGKLKPEMFVRAIVHSRIAQGGKVMDPAMAGKWICPMHPDVVKTEAGNCDVCGMDLVTTESLGYVAAEMTGAAPLVIPASAPLITGTRAVVYVQLPDREKPTFEGREIVLGPRAGDYYIVKSGLSEGEIVVTNGNFKIDSALQIQAKPSMMSAEGGEVMAEHRRDEVEHKRGIIEVSDEFRRQFWQMIEGYLALQKAFAADDIGEAAKSAGPALKSLSEVDMSLLSGEAHSVWMSSSSAMIKALEGINKSGDIEQARKEFKLLSNELMAAIERLGVSYSTVLYKFNCPMAFGGKGADWLQADKDTRNPYLGSSMLKCGSVIEVIGDKVK